LENYSFTNSRFHMEFYYKWNQLDTYDMI